MTFAVIGRNFVPFAVLALIAAVPQALSLHYLSNMSNSDGRVNPVALLTAGGSFFGTWLLSLIIQYVLQAALTYSTFMDLTKKPISISQALMTGLRVFFPLVAIGILAGLGIVAGLILLVVPGLMLFTAWMVTVPAYIVEKRGIFESFSRSAELTSGHRWPLFGLMIIYAVGAGLIDLLARPFLGLPIFSSTLDFPIGFLVFTVVLRTIELVISATGIAVIYYLLRSSKEGVGAADLASVFE